MCGINGIISPTPTTELAGRVQHMNSSMEHRGPDDEGLYHDDYAAIGHRRLSIIDLSPAGHQPFLSNDQRYAMVYNGELYNWKEIKADIPEYDFKTDCDTEVIIAAYMKWGTACVERFNGMFSLAIWDKEEKELFCVRDRVGIKPLYYHLDKGTFTFSSEIRSLLASNLVPKRMNEAGLLDFLRYQTVHSPNTIIKDVFCLPAGCFGMLKDGKLEVTDYWNLNDRVSYGNDGKSYDETKKDVRQLIEASVERRMMADVPFGAFLSGGIDSSAIVGLMSKVSSKPVSTFSVSFEEKEFSEAKYAELIAKKYKTNHTQINLTIEDFLNDLPSALKAMDHPSGDGPNTYVVSKVTKAAGITMALSGLGGDELFAGYDIFQRAKRLEGMSSLNMVPKALRLVGGRLLNAARPGVASTKIAKILSLDRIDFEHFYPVARQVLSDHQISSLVMKDLYKGNYVSEILEQKLSGNNYETYSKVSIAEMNTYMRNVLLRDTDQMSMASSLEVRVPFLDHVLVEYVLGIPDQHKSPTSPKRLLVDALKEFLPDSIVNRPKMGFVLPWKEWMKGELKSFCEEKLQALGSRSVFSEVAIQNLWKDFLSGSTEVSWVRLWMLVVLENWLNEQGIDD